MTPEKYISFQQVSKRYQDITAVDNLDLNVFKGDIYGFLGPNGAGKSTSIRMMLSLVKPSTGQIKLFEKDLKTERIKTLQRIGALIEKPDFYKYLTARKNLEILARLSNYPVSKKKINEVLDMVKLLSRSESKVKTFSQGMRQRLGIAQTLLHDPYLIILDEPSNGLDPQGQKEIRSLIRQINDEKKITIVISSHILSEIEQIANRMIIVNKGKAVVEGHVDELLSTYGMDVKIKVSNPEKALEKITTSVWEPYLLENTQSQFHFRLEQEKIPQLNTWLVNSNIDVFNIDTRRSLEDYFISKTHNE